MVCVTGLQEYPRGGIFVELAVQFSNPVPHSSMTDFLWHDLIDLTMGIWVSVNLSLRRTSFLDFLHDGNGLAFLFFLSNYWRLFPRRADWWLDFLFLYIPKIQAYLHLMTRLHWNGLIFRDGVVIAWAGTVKRFIFLFSDQLCHSLVAIKRVGWFQRSSKTFILETDTQNLHSLHLSCASVICDGDS